MRSFPSIWSRMTAAVLSKPLFWTILLAWPVLAGVHLAATGGFVIHALGALAFSIPAAMGLCWFGSRARSATCEALRPTLSGCGIIMWAELSLCTILGAVPPLALLAGFTAIRGGTMPWQIWIVAPCTSLLTASLVLVAGRWSRSLAAAAVFIPALLSFLPVRPLMLRLAAFPAQPGWTVSWSTEGEGRVHPDAYVALGFFASGAACFAAAAGRHGRSGQAS
jgi:hypothetical protein